MLATPPVRFCNDEFAYDASADASADPTTLAPLRDSGGIAGDAEALRERLASDGYLWVRGLLDREEVLTARRAILGYMDEHEGLEPGARPLDGVMGRYGKPVKLENRREVTESEPVRRVLESPRLFELTERILGEPTQTFRYKWLRAVGNEEATGCHMDHVYMGRGSPRVLTCWVPLGDLPMEQGTLAVCEGSSSERSFEELRETYGRGDVDRDGGNGWYTLHPREVSERFGGRWRTSPVSAGDVIVFGMHMMHASTTNTTDRWRVSCDVRFQPAADPVDPRWAGDHPIGHGRG